MFTLFLGWLFWIFWCLAECYFLFVGFYILWSFMDLAVTVMEVKEYERMGD